MEAKAILVAWRIHVLLFLILASNIYRQPQNTVSIFTLAEDYLRYESLIYLLLLFFLLEHFPFTTGKNDTYVCLIALPTCVSSLAQRVYKSIAWFP